MNTPARFIKAKKSQAKAKIAITGPSGSGKTLSALLLAKGLGGRVGVIDTENSSASLYEDRIPDFEYFTAALPPPFTPLRFKQAIDVAYNEGIEVLIIDSLTHAWDGKGGALDAKDVLDKRPGSNSFTNWRAISKDFSELITHIVTCPMHVIVTMRSKQAYVLEANDKGKQMPRKVGLEPIMRDGIEYEFSVVFEIGMDHEFTVTKDRTDLFGDIHEKINEETGNTIRNWLTASPVTPTDKTT